MVRWAMSRTRAHKFVTHDEFSAGKSPLRDGLIDQIVEATSFQLPGISPRTRGYCLEGTSVGRRTNVLQDTEKFRDRGEHAWLAAAVRTTFSAVERRAVLVPDDREGLVGVSCDVGGSTDDGLEPDPASQRDQRQRVRHVATGEKHVEALSVRSPAGVDRPIIRRRTRTARAIRQSWHRWPRASVMPTFS